MPIKTENKAAIILEMLTHKRQVPDSTITTTRRHIKEQFGQEVSQSFAQKNLIKYRGCKNINEVHQREEDLKYRNITMEQAAQLDDSFPNNYTKPANPNENKEEPKTEEIEEQPEKQPEEPQTEEQPQEQEKPEESISETITPEVMKQINEGLRHAQPVSSFFNPATRHMSAQVLEHILENLEETIEDANPYIPSDAKNYHLTMKDMITIKQNIYIYTKQILNSLMEKMSKDPEKHKRCLAHIECEDKLAEIAESIQNGTNSTKAMADYHKIPEYYLKFLLTRNDENKAETGNTQF